MRVSAAVMLSGVPEAVDHGTELLYPAAGVGGEVELAVEAEEAVDVPVLLDLLLDLLQPRHCCGRQVRDALGECQGFDTFTDLVDALALGHVHLRHPRTAV